MSNYYIKNEHRHRRNLLCLQQEENHQGYFHLLIDLAFA